MKGVLWKIIVSPIRKGTNSDNTNIEGKVRSPLPCSMIQTTIYKGKVVATLSHELLDCFGLSF